MIIEWTDDLKLGFPAIDNEHREMVGLCNTLLRAINSDASFSTLADFLDHLMLQTRAHFISEEQLLDRHGYPAFVQHKAEHDRLLAQAESLRMRYGDIDQDCDGQALKADTAQFLTTWLMDHIRGGDKPYRPFLMNLA